MIQLGPQKTPTDWPAPLMVTVAVDPPSEPTAQNIFYLVRSLALCLDRSHWVQPHCWIGAYIKLGSDKARRREREACLAAHSLLSWNRSWPNLYLAFYLCHGILQTLTYHTRCLFHLGYNVQTQLLSIKILYCHSFPPQFESTVGSHLAPKANQRLPHEISNCGGKLVWH